MNNLLYSKTFRAAIEREFASVRLKSCKKMVICAIIGCSNRSNRDKVRFFSLPAIVRDKGDQMLSITTERRCAWLKAISRQDLVGEKLKNTFVCEKHFVTSMLGHYR